MLRNRRMCLKRVFRGQSHARLINVETQPQRHLLRIPSSKFPPIPSPWISVGLLFRHHKLLMSLYVPRLFNRNNDQLLASYHNSQNAFSFCNCARISALLRMSHFSGSSFLSASKFLPLHHRWPRRYDVTFPNWGGNGAFGVQGVHQPKYHI